MQLHNFVSATIVLLSINCFAMMPNETVPCLPKTEKSSRICCSILADLCELLQYYNPQQIAPNSPRMREIMVSGNNDSFRTKPIRLIRQEKK